MASTSTKHPTSPPPLPQFLQFTRAGVREKFIDLEWQQRTRLAQGNGLIQASPSTSQSSVGSSANSQTSSPQPQTAQWMSPWSRPSGREIMKRNRYMNIDPYTSNRVRLKVPEGVNDYINASPIVLNGKQGIIKRFIATQGPKELSLPHMWRMIWHETGSVAVVVMLTQTYEAGREKCFQYFPIDQDNPTLDISDKNDEFNDAFEARVELVNSTFDEAARSTIRELKMTVEGYDETKTVWHYLFDGWPDFLVPEGEDRMALIELINQSAVKSAKGGPGAHGEKESPRIVHCSAGVGRSGTFIALDYLLAELDVGVLDHVPDGEDPIVDTVDELRKQRMMMVQGESQFLFLYELLKEKWLKRHGQTIST